MPRHAVFCRNTMLYSYLVIIIRYRWLCEHYFPEERSRADPANYHHFPFRAFYADLRFYMHFFSFIFVVFHNKYVQFVMSIVLLNWMHYYSHVLYMMPLPMLKMHYPCVEVPSQPMCEVLNFVQQNTFDGMKDMRKTIVTLITTGFVSNVMAFIKPRGF